MAYVYIGNLGEMLELFYSRLFYFFYILKVLIGQKLRSLQIEINLNTKVGLKIQLRRKIQLHLQPIESLFSGLLVNMVDSSFSLVQ